MKALSGNEFQQEINNEMARKRINQRRSGSSRKQPNSPAVLRVIGGDMRGRTFQYNGDAGLRPMKDRVREAVFNLIGPAVKGKHVIDLFGGTGAMAFEAISRGAISAQVIERRFPNASMIEANAESLGVADKVQVQAADTFIAHKRIETPLLATIVFCCPPYEFYASRTDETVEMIKRMCDLVPAMSMILVESDGRFDTSLLPNAEAWDVRTYSPAVVALYET